MFGYIAARIRPQENTGGAEGPGLLPVAEVMRHFPVGGKIRYYPDYRPDVTMDSIVIAYGINNHLVYAQRDIRLDETSANGPRFVLDDDWRDRPITHVERFCLVIPDIGGLEHCLDYDTRANLRNGGQLQRGDQLTLMSLFSRQGLPHVETMVRKRVTLKEGYYANHSVIVLEVDPDSLRLVDQRRHRRIRTNLPVTVAVSGCHDPFTACLVDFSEYSLRMRCGQDLLTLAGLGSRKIYVRLEIPTTGRHFDLQGRLVRCGDEDLVLGLTHLRVGEEFEEIGLLSALDIKASLLQHPETG